MLEAVQGVLEAKGDGWVVVQVASISLRIQVPASTTSHLVVGAPLRLYTHLQLKEEGLALYGFLSPEEKRTFELLLGVSGVGPRLALSIVSSLSPQSLAAAIASGDLEVLSRLPGVGKKTASRIILELKEKIWREWAGVPLSEVHDQGDLMAALLALGYSPSESRSAWEAIRAEASHLSLEERVRLALRHLAKG